MNNEEKRKLTEIKQKRDGKEWWKFLKEGEISTEDEMRKEIRIGGEISTDEEKIKRHVKEYWEEIGKSVGKGKTYKNKVNMRKK